MSVFKDILSKIKNRLDIEQNKRTIIIEAIKNIVGIDIKESQVIIKNGHIFISSVPTIKMAISIKKEEIISSLKSKGIIIHSIV